MTLDTNNPTSLSPKQKLVEEVNRKRRAEWAKGEWPPEGSPWRPLLRCPLERVQELFRAEALQALLVGVRQLRDNANAVALNTHHPQAMRDEACGNVHAYDVILGLEEEILGVVKMLTTPEA